MKKWMIYALLALTGLFMAQCTPKSSSTADQAAADEALMARGFQLLESNCFSCHSPEGTHENRVAPPIFAVKNHYAELDEAAFIAAVVDYVKAPAQEKTRMPGAVKRFGLMPVMGFTEEDLTAVATYIFRTELDAPGWYADHYKQEQEKYLSMASEHPNYLTHGNQLALSTKAVLGKNLMAAIQSKGTAAALEFCNTRAIHLTDSMSGILATRIRRVSDKARNPANRANLNELEYIRRSQHLMESDAQIPPMVQRIDGKMVGYYPILTNAMCLQCHGGPADIQAETEERLNALYPNDKATGYGENQLRGIWVVEMEE